MKEALKLALEALEEAQTNDDGMEKWDRNKNAITAIKAALTQPAQEPVAWRTFDGEGGYDYRSYENNESYADDWNKRNPNHKGWVEPLYTTPQPAQERNFCSRCGKRTADLTVIHTCTPPQENT